MLHGTSMLTAPFYSHPEELDELDEDDDHAGLKVPKLPNGS